MPDSSARSVDRLAADAPILIAGAGVAGLTAALSLHRAGFANIRIADAGAEDAEPAVGLSLPPTAVRELAALGLLDAVQGRAVRLSTLELRSSSGALLQRDARGVEAGYGWPHLSVHGEVLLEELRAAVAERLGPDAIAVGTRVVGAEGAAGAVRVRVQDSATGFAGERTLRAAVVIGADGLDSALRRQLRPEEGEPIEHGSTVLHGLAWCRPFGDACTMRVVGDDRRRLVVAPVLHRSGPLDLTHWTTTVRAPAAGLRTPAARRAAVTAAFDGWSLADLSLADLFAATDEVGAWSVVDRAPLDTWIRGGVVLVGDAAHPIYPAGPGGASQAILDARVLARQLTERPAPLALEGYDAERRRAIDLLQRRLLGRSLELALADPGDEPDEVNARPSLDPPKGLVV
ncbi:MAG: FAD-dependent monooxygenase [Patulibacter minatonensis]